PPPPSSPLFPYTTLFRSHDGADRQVTDRGMLAAALQVSRSQVLQHPGALAAQVEQLPDKRLRLTPAVVPGRRHARLVPGFQVRRSEEHTSELQSRGHLVC